MAYRYHKGNGPALVFLPGYMSDMEGSKALALMEWAKANGRACLLLDYSGCGKSEGEFADGTLSKWRDEVLALLSALSICDVILIGSSMGGWLMLMIGLALGDRLKGMAGLAAAPDFTSWGYDEAQKTALAQGETVYEDNPYGPEPTPTYAKFWADGEDNLMLGAPIAITAPVRLIHGQADSDVPWAISLRLAGVLQSEDVRLTLIKDAGHRLSHEQDIALILQAIAQLP